MKINTMDFRYEAVEASRDLLKKDTIEQITSQTPSLCLPVPGGTTLLALYEMTGLAAAIMLIGVLLAGVYFFCLDKPLLWSAGCVSLSFGGLLIHGKIVGGILNTVLKRRAGNIVCGFADISESVGIEDALTTSKVKVMAEDRGLFVLDAQGGRILIEGCAYRYVIRKEDIRAVGQATEKGMSAATLRYKIGNVELDLAITIAFSTPAKTLQVSQTPDFASSNFRERIANGLKLGPAFRLKAAEERAVTEGSKETCSPKHRILKYAVFLTLVFGCFGGAMAGTRLAMLAPAWLEELVFVRLCMFGVGMAVGAHVGYQASKLLKPKLLATAGESVEAGHTSENRAKSTPAREHIYWQVVRVVDHFVMIGVFFLLMVGFVWFWDLSRPLLRGVSAIMFVIITSMLLAQLAMIPIYLFSDRRK